jgi:hypothetical protein
MRRHALTLATLIVLPAALHAQRWTPIGKTSSGNDVFVDARSVRRTGSLVAANVRVVFSTPVQTPKGVWASSRTTATFDCTKKSLAAKENVFYADAKGTRVTERTVNKLPGYGPALKGSLGDVAMTHLCSR